MSCVPSRPDVFRLSSSLHKAPYPGLINNAETARQTLATALQSSPPILTNQDAASLNSFLYTLSSSMRALDDQFKAQLGTDWVKQHIHSRLSASRLIARDAQCSWLAHRPPPEMPSWQAFRASGQDMDFTRPQATERIPYILRNLRDLGYTHERLKRVIDRLEDGSTPVIGAEILSECGTWLTQCQALRHALIMQKDQVDASTKGDRESAGDTPSETPQDQFESISST